MKPEFDWQDALEQLFAATVNQEPLEDASQVMVEVSSHDPEYHEECLFLFEKGRALSREGDDAIIGYINKSGYKVSSHEEALNLINDFEAEYLRAFAAHR